MPVKHLLQHLDNPSKPESVGADLVLLANSAAANAPVYTPVSGLKGMVAANIVNTPAGNMAAADLQAAVNSLQTQIDGLVSVGGKNTIGKGGAPIAADGVDGDYLIDLSTGDWYGPKAANVWPPAPVGNAFALLGFITTAGAAPTVAGTVGTSALAARGDHSHRFQTALETPINPAIADVVGANVAAGLADLGAKVAANTAAIAAIPTPSLQSVTDTGNTTTNNIIFTGAAGVVFPASGAQQRRITMDPDTGALIASDPF